MVGVYPNISLKMKLPFLIHTNSFLAGGECLCVNVGMLVNVSICLCVSLMCEHEGYS